MLDVLVSFAIPRMDNSIFPRALRPGRESWLFCVPSVPVWGGITIFLQAGLHWNRASWSCRGRCPPCPEAQKVQPKQQGKNPQSTRRMQTGERILVHTIRTRGARNAHVLARANCEKGKRADETARHQATGLETSENVDDVNVRSRKL